MQMNENPPWRDGLLFIRSDRETIAIGTVLLKMDIRGLLRGTGGFCVFFWDLGGFSGFGRKLWHS